jgi:hypothetical protein
LTFLKFGNLEAFYLICIDAEYMNSIMIFVKFDCGIMLIVAELDYTVTVYTHTHTHTHDA